MEYIPIILTLMIGLDGNLDWDKYEATYKDGYDTYIECKQFTLNNVYKERIRQILENPNILRVKSGCTIRPRSTRLGVAPI